MGYACDILRYESGTEKANINSKKRRYSADVADRRRLGRGGDAKGRSCLLWKLILLSLTHNHIHVI